MNLTVNPCPHRGCEHGEHSHSLLIVEREFDVVEEYGSCAICTSEKNHGAPGQHPCAACQSLVDQLVIDPMTREKKHFDRCDHAQSQHNDKGCHAVVGFTEDKPGETAPVCCSCGHFT